MEMVRRASVIFVLVFAFFVMFSPTVTLAVEPAATPDPGYGGVPLCQNSDDTDCVPDPGPKPEDGKILYTIIDGARHCNERIVDITIISDRIVRSYVLADNLWHIDTEEVDQVVSTRPMNDVELAGCGPNVTPEPIVLPDPVQPTEPAITPESVVSEQSTVPETVVGTDQPAAEEPADQSVQVKSLPNTGIGTPDGNSFWIFFGGVSAMLALAGAARRRRV